MAGDDAAGDLDRAGRVPPGAFPCLGAGEAGDSYLPLPHEDFGFVGAERRGQEACGVRRFGALQGVGVGVHQQEPAGVLRLGRAQQAAERGVGEVVVAYEDGQPGPGEPFVGEVRADGVEDAVQFGTRLGRRGVGAGCGSRGQHDHVGNGCEGGEFTEAEVGGAPYGRTDGGGGAARQRYSLQAEQ